MRPALLPSPWELRLSANSLTFGNSGIVSDTTSSLGATGGYTFTNGQTLTLGSVTTGSNIITMAPGVGAVTLQGPVVLASPATAQTYTITNASSNLLTFGSTFTESAAPGGSAAANTITVLFNGTGGVTFNGAINGNNNNNPGGNILLNLAGSQVVAINAADGSVGQVSVNATSTLNVGNALAIQTYNLNLVNGSTVNFTNGITSATVAGLSGAGGTLTLTNTSSQAVALTLQGASLGNGNQQLDQNPTSATNISGLGSVTIVGVTASGNNPNSGTETLTGVLSFTGTGGLNVANTGSTGPGNVAGNNTLTLVLQGADTYTGPTTVQNKGTLTVNTNGSIANSSAYNILTGATLNLTPGAANTADMLNTSGTVTLSNNPATSPQGGGNLNLTGNTTNSVTQTFASLALGSGNQVISITGATGKITTLSAGSVTNSVIRSSFSTALIRATNLGQGSAAGAAVAGNSYFTLGDAGASLGLVGTNTLASGTAGDTTQALKIVPYLFGDTNPAGNGSNFLTYDSTLGLRVLTAAEDTALAAGSVTAANPVNAVAFNGTVTTPNLTVNSLLFSGATQTLQGSGTLTVNSGAVASISTADVIGNGFNALNLGNGEGVITVASGDALTVNTAVNVVGTGSNDLIKTGAGTLTLNGSEILHRPHGHQSGNANRIFCNPRCGNDQPDHHLYA